MEHGFRDFEIKCDQARCLGWVNRVDPDGIPARPLWRRQRTSTHDREGAGIGHPDGLPKRTANGPSNCLTVIKRPAARTSRSSYLSATAPLDRPVSERESRNSA